MKTLRIAAGLIGVVAVLSPSISAQWAAYAPKAEPKNPDGTVNLNAPTPRLPDGKPDLSGLWVNGRGGGQALAATVAGERGRGAGQPAPPAPGAAAAPAAPAAAPAAPAADGAAAQAPAGGRGRGRGQQPLPVAADGTPLANFGNIGAGFKDGLPFTPWAAELQKTRQAGNSKDNPDALCLPMGFMQFHTHPQPRKMIQTPGLLVLIYEANYGLRQIFTDGRTLPTGDAQPFWYGYSVGRWEGDTLVVETTGLREDGWLDVRGSPYTEKAKITERFRRLNYGTLEIDVTVDDPMAYTKPFTVRVNQRLMPDQELIEFICAENQKFDQYLRGDLKPKP
ncbi:MAG: hypothetical protein ABI868_01520 [Acidobacteriota bacterium]